MKVSTTYLILLVAVFICCLASCRTDDDMITFPSCPEGDSYALDINPTSFFGEVWLWLNDDKGELAYEERLTPTGGSPVFFDLEAACESTYTLSLGMPFFFSFEQGTGATIIVEEIAEVPSGLGLSVFGEVRNNSFAGFFSGRQVMIANCPPVDSVIMDYGTTELELPDDDLHTFSYNEAEQNLTITLADGYTASDNGALAIRLADNQSWLGGTVVYSTFFNLLEYADFVPLVERELTISSTLPEHEVTLLEVQMIRNTSSGSSAVLGTSRSGQLRVLTPENNPPVQVLVRTEGDDVSYEKMLQFDEWPTTLDLSTTGLAIDDVSMNYPNLDVNTLGGDVLVLKSRETDTTNGGTSLRIFRAPARTGAQMLTLPTIGPAFDQAARDGADDYQSVIETGRLSLLRYPNINGNYRNYLRKVIGSNASADWRAQREYEKLSVLY